MNKDWQALSMHWEAKAKQFEVQLAETGQRAIEFETWLAEEKRLTAQLEAENAKLRAVLEAAGYNDIDDMLTKDIEVCRRTGEAVHALTQLHIDAGVSARNQLESVTAENAELKAQLAKMEVTIRQCDRVVTTAYDERDAANARAEAYRGWLEGFEVEELDSLGTKTAGEARHWGRVAAGIHSLTINRANQACQERATAEAEAARLHKISEKLWTKVNEWRCRLIEWKVAGDVSERDLGELNELQSLADEYASTVAPLPIAELEAYMREQGIEIPAAALQEGKKEGE